MRTFFAWLLQIIFPFLAYGEGSPSGVFSFVEGDEVAWDSSSRNQRVVPLPGEVFASQDRLQTGSKSRSEMVFAENVVIRIGPYTLFTLQQEERLLKLEEGSVLLQKDPSAKPWELQTGGLIAAVSGSTLLVSRPDPQTEIIYLLETSNARGLEIRFPAGTPQLPAPLKTGQLLISENNQTREVIPFDPALLWNSSPLGKIFPGTVWPACIGQIPSRTPPRASLAWGTNWNSCEGYPAAVARRMEKLLPVDRQILRGAYGDPGGIPTLIREGSGSLMVDPEGHHPLSAALDTARMDLVRLLLPAFQGSPYLARGRQIFPAHMLARSPLPRAILMLPEQEFSEFLKIAPPSRRDVWDAAAVVGNYLLRREDGPQGFFADSIPRNWITLTRLGTGLSREEQRQLISNVLIPVLMSFSGWDLLFSESFFIPAVGESRLPLQTGVVFSKSEKPITPLPFVQNARANLIGGIGMEDNFQMYLSARAQQLEFSPKVELFLPGQDQSAKTKPKAFVTLHDLASDLLRQPATPYSDHFIPALRLLSLVLGPQATPWPFFQPPGQAQRASSADTLPEDFRELAQNYLRTQENGSWREDVRLVAGRLVLPLGEKAVASPLRLAPNGTFAGPVQKGRGALFYIRGHWPLFLPYPDGEGGWLAWWGDLQPKPMHAADGVGVKGRLAPVRTPPNPQAKPRLEISLADPPYPMASGSMAGSSPDWDKTVAKITFSPTDSFEVKGLAPLPYHMVIRFAGFLPWTGQFFPTRGQILDLGTLPIKEAPRISVSHLERSRLGSGSWQDPLPVASETLICDGETPWASRTRDSQGNPLAQIQLDPRENLIEARPSGGFRIRDLGFMVVVGPGSFARLPAESIGSPDNSPATSMELKKGRTYLLEGDGDHGSLQWLIAIGP